MRNIPIFFSGVLVAILSGFPASGLAETLHNPAKPTVATTAPNSTPSSRVLDPGPNAKCDEGAPGTDLHKLNTELNSIWVALKNGPRDYDFKRKREYRFEVVDDADLQRIHKEVTRHLEDVDRTLQTFCEVFGNPNTSASLTGFYRDPVDSDDIIRVTEVGETVEKALNEKKFPDSQRAWLTSQLKKLREIHEIKKRDRESESLFRYAKEDGEKDQAEFNRLMQGLISKSISKPEDREKAIQWMIDKVGVKKLQFYLHLHEHRPKEGDDWNNFAGIPRAIIDEMQPLLTKDWHRVFDTSIREYRGPDGKPIPDSIKKSLADYLAQNGADYWDSQGWNEKEGDPRPNVVAAKGRLQAALDKLSQAADPQSLLAAHRYLKELDGLRGTGKGDRNIESTQLGAAQDAIYQLAGIPSSPDRSEVHFMTHYRNTKPPSELEADMRKDYEIHNGRHVSFGFLSNFRANPILKEGGAVLDSIRKVTAEIKAAHLTQKKEGPEYEEAKSLLTQLMTDKQTSSERGSSIRRLVALSGSSRAVANLWLGYPSEEDTKWAGAGDEPVAKTVNPTDLPRIASGTAGTSSPASGPGGTQSASPSGPIDPTAYPHPMLPGSVPPTDRGVAPAATEAVTKTFVHPELGYEFNATRGKHLGVVTLSDGTQANQYQAGYQSESGWISNGTMIEKNGKHWFYEAPEPEVPPYSIQGGTNPNAGYHLGVGSVLPDTVPATNQVSYQNTPQVATPYTPQVPQVVSPYLPPTFSTRRAPPTYSGGGVRRPRSGGFRLFGRWRR